MAESVFDWSVSVSFTGNLESFIPVTAEEPLAELAAVWREKKSRFSPSQLVEEVSNRFSAWYEIVCVCWLTCNPSLKEFLVAGSLVSL
jgi:hypothetical protein